MKKNIGNQESNMRMVAGALIVLFALFVVQEPTIKIILATVAAILAGTAFLHFCPINMALKRDTSEEEKHVKEEADLEKEPKTQETSNDEEKSEETGEEELEKSTE